VHREGELVTVPAGDIHRVAHAAWQPRDHPSTPTRLRSSRSAPTSSMTTDASGGSPPVPRQSSPSSRRRRPAGLETGGNASPNDPSPPRRRAPAVAPP
jgi:hypothetical protein